MREENQALCGMRLESRYIHISKYRLIGTTPNGGVTSSPSQSLLWLAISGSSTGSPVPAALATSDITVGYI